MKSILECVSEQKRGTRCYYEALLEFAGPGGVVWDSLLDAWVVTSYELCSSLLQSDHLERERVRLPQNVIPELADVGERIINAQMMFRDSPETGVHRAAWADFFQSGLKDSFQSAMCRYARGSISGCASNEDADVYGTVLQAYVSRVIFGRLGFSEEERERHYPSVWRYIRFLDGKAVSGESLATAVYALIDLYDHVARRERLEPIVPYSRHEWIADFILALAAGHESTAYLLATVFLAQDVLQPIRDGRVRLPSVVTEALRYDSPVQIIGRRVKTDIRLKGKELKTGERVLLHIGAANRDGAAYEDPHSFNIFRDNTRPPLSFGLAKGKCAGRSLAMRSALTFLETLLEREEWFEVDNENAVRDDGLAARGLSELPGHRIAIR